MNETMGHTRALPVLGNEHSHEKPYYLNAYLIKSNRPQMLQNRERRPYPMYRKNNKQK